MWFSQLWPGYDDAASIWQPVSEIPKFGVWPLIVGTVKVTIVFDGGGGSAGRRLALYVSQYARPRTREIVKPLIELLAGIPSVVLGFFALIVMATWFQEHLRSSSPRLNAVVSGVALSFAVIPVIFTLSEEAFRAVPRSYVEASTALGAARWERVLRVLLPAGLARHRGRRRARARARHWRDDDRPHGVRQRRHHLGELRRLGTHDLGDHRGELAEVVFGKRTTRCYSSWERCSSSRRSSSTPWATGRSAA